MKNAVYVSNLGTPKKPYCKMGLCAIEKVPEEALFVLTSSKAKQIFLIAEMLNKDFAIVSNPDAVEYGLIPYIIIKGIRDILCGFITGSRALPHKIEKDFRKPSPTDEKRYAEFLHKVIDSYNEKASKITLEIYDAIKEAVKQGEKLESIFFGGKFNEMSGKAKISYKVEWRRGKNVVVGGKIVFAQKLPGSILTISDEEINLSGAGGWNGAVFCLCNPHEEITKEEKKVIDAIVAFFARCYAKQI